MIGSQETRRDGQDAFTAAGSLCTAAALVKVVQRPRVNTDRCRASRILHDLENIRLAVKFIRARPMKARLNLKRKPKGISFVAAYAPTKSHKSIRDEALFWATLGSTVVQVPKGEHLLVIMDANA